MDTEDEDDEDDEDEEDDEVAADFKNLDKSTAARRSMEQQQVCTYLISSLIT